MGRKAQQPGAGRSSAAAAAAARSSKGKEKVSGAPEKARGRPGRPEKLLASSMAAAAAVVTRSRRRMEAEAGEQGGAAGRRRKEAPPAREKQQPRAARTDAEDAAGTTAGDTARTAAGDAARTATATGTGAGRIFFKVYLEEVSAELLKIPSPFWKYLGQEPNNKKVSLKGPSGNTWPVLLTSDSAGLNFTEGWKKFVRDHSLLSGHFLVFTYDGQSQFSVVVLDASGVEDKKAFSVKPSEDIVVEAEEEGGVADANAAAAHASPPPVDEGNATTRKRARPAPDGMQNGTAPKKHTRVQKAPVANDTIHGSPCPLNDPSRNRVWHKSKNFPRIGTFVSKKVRQPVMISQRRPVTGEEKSHALERAREFESINPFFVQVMTESYVYVGFFMNIPCGFVRESLPRASRKMKLWDPCGQPWEVNYVYYHDRNVAAFSGGWGKFAVAHNLEKFDVCVFELIKEDNIKVHIYRVVQDLTPLIRKSNM